MQLPDLLSKKNVYMYQNQWKYILVRNEKILADKKNLEHDPKILEKQFLSCCCGISVHE